MESRMEKYQDFDIEEFQRSKKNADLYKEVYGKYGDFENLPIPENTNEIDIENLKSLVESRSSKRKQQLDNFSQNNEIDSVVTSEENKVYDINTLLEKAKEENAKIKKEEPINKNVPNYLANLESDKNTKEIILKYDGDNDDDLPIIKEVTYVTSEIDLQNKTINTSTLSLDILSDLKPSGNTGVSEIINDFELIEEKKEFFGDRTDFSEKDFEENDDELVFVENEGNYLFLKVFLVIIVLSSILTAGYFILKEYTNIF